MNFERKKPVTGRRTTIALEELCVLHITVTFTTLAHAYIESPSPVNS